MPIAAGAAFRQKRGSFSNWNAGAKLRRVHDTIEDKDVECQHELAMLMLDGFVRQFEIHEFLVHFTVSNFFRQVLVFAESSVESRFDSIFPCY
jgi:hypothetical protein